MSRAMERLIAPLLILTMAGCTAATTRFPTCFPQQSTNSEIKSYTLHDPFPDEDAGPDTGTRPLIFNKPRTETTKNYAARNLRAAYGYPPRMYSWDPPMPVSTNPYPFQPVWQTQAAWETQPVWQAPIMQ